MIRRLYICIPPINKERAEEMLRQWEETDE